MDGVQESLELNSKYVAIVPLCMYCSSFVTSAFMKILNHKAGRKISYSLGGIVGLAAAGWVYYGGDEQGKADEVFKHYGIFFAGGMFGAAGSAVLITSLSLTAELIGPNTESAGFVYGAMSFTDKVSNGLAVMVIQHFIPCIKVGTSSDIQKKSSILIFQMTLCFVRNNFLHHWHFLNRAQRKVQF